MTNYPGDKADLNSALHFGDTPFDEADYEEESDTSDAPGTHAKVDKLPKCNFCDRDALYDFKTQQGPWAYGCRADYETYRLYLNLGTGMGQKLVLIA